MKKISKVLYFILLALPFCVISCQEQNKESRETMDQSKMRELTLIFSVSGGTRAHIIDIGQNNELTYRIGSFSASDDFDISKVKWNNNYKEVKKQLNNDEIGMIKSYCSRKEYLIFNDPKIVKDSWEYYLYIDGSKVAFGRKFNYEDFPIELKNFINYILEITGKLYDISGMS